MKTFLTKTLTTLALTFTLTSSANAGLIERLDGQAFYDDVLDITWLTDGLAARGTAFDDGYPRTSGDENTDGRMTWASAMRWAESLSVGGVSGWRLPKTGPLNGIAYDDSRFYNDGRGDVGLNISRLGTLFGGSTASEMAHLFYDTLGNVSNWSIEGRYDNGCISTNCLDNTGPFSNLLGIFWSSTEYSISTGARTFSFGDGSQSARFKDGANFALAVHDGDISAVPEPPMLLLLGTVFAGLVGRSR